MGEYHYNFVWCAIKLIFSTGVPWCNIRFLLILQGVLLFEDITDLVVPVNRICHSNTVNHFKENNFLLMIVHFIQRKLLKYTSE